MTQEVAFNGPRLQTIPFISSLGHGKSYSYTCISMCEMFG